MRVPCLFLWTTPQKLPQDGLVRGFFNVVASLHTMGRAIVSALGLVRLVPFCLNTNYDLGNRDCLEADGLRVSENNTDIPATNPGRDTPVSITHHTSNWPRVFICTIQF